MVFTPDSVFISSSIFSFGLWDSLVRTKGFCPSNRPYFDTVFPKSSPLRLLISTFLLLLPAPSLPPYFTTS
ncbi:hypothetical protein GEMRC1_011006 [Eukaryota sp. GEM-RC1]